MLTSAEIKATKEELQANYRRLNQPEATVLADLEINAERLDAVLNMEHPDPHDIWEVRDYLEDKRLTKTDLPQVIAFYFL